MAQEGSLKGLPFCWVNMGPLFPSVDGERGGSCGLEPDVEGDLGEISEVLLLAPGDLGENSGGVTRSLSLDDLGVNLGGAGLGR